MGRFLYVSATAVGAFLMLAAQTPYPDVRSNLQSWIEAVGMSKISIPSAADDWAFYLGLVLVVLGVPGALRPWTWRHHFSSESSRQAPAVSGAAPTIPGPAPNPDPYLDINHGINHQAESIRRVATLRRLRINFPDRIITDDLPEYVIELASSYKLSKDRDRMVSPFIGKWYLVNGDVDEVKVGESSVFVAISVDERGYRFISMYFALSWAERLSVVRHEQRIWAFGRLSEVGMSYAVLEECEVLEDILE